MDKSYEWQHAIIRFIKTDSSSGGRTVVSADEAVTIADSFAKEWKSKIGGAVNYGLVVYHGYSSTTLQESVSKQDFARVPHLHIIFKYYKGTKAKPLIEQFASKEGFKVLYSGIRSVEGLTKYLLQGRGRVLLCETGKCPEGEVCDRAQSIWAEGEATRCEDNIWVEQNESCEPSSGRHRNDDDEEPGPHQTKKVRESVKTLRKIESLLMKYRVKDETNLSTMMNDDERDWYDDVVITTKEWNRVFLQARTNVTTRIKSMRWEDIMRTLPDDPKAYSTNTMSVARSLKVFHKILEHQQWNKDERLRFVRNMYAVVNNNIVGHKRNTFYMEGEVSAGKTLITKSVCASVIFAFHTGEYNSRSSDFHFEDMMNARVASLEEPQIEAGKIDKFKVILGGEAFDTNVKFKVKGKVDRVPVLISTNYPITRFAREAENAFEERWYKWIFRYGNVGKHIKITGPLHPKMWLTLIEHYGLTIDQDSDSDGSEFDFAEFADTPLRPDRRRLGADRMSPTASDDELTAAVKALEAAAAADGPRADERSESTLSVGRPSSPTQAPEWIKSLVTVVETVGTDAVEPGIRQQGKLPVKRKLFVDSDSESEHQIQSTPKRNTTERDEARARNSLLEDTYPSGGTIKHEFESLKKAVKRAINEDFTLCYCLGSNNQCGRVECKYDLDFADFFKKINRYFAIIAERTEDIFEIQIWNTRYTMDENAADKDHVYYDFCARVGIDDIYVHPILIE